MSHTTVIKSVPIKDINALEKAVQELKDKGVNCDLVQNQKVRMYSVAQSNSLGVCDYVLKLHDSPYDVGFVKQADGTYSPAFDDWSGHVKRNVGTSCPVPNTAEAKHQANIGALMQGYSKHAAINSAVNSGYIVESTTVDAEGNVHLTLSV